MGWRYEVEVWTKKEYGHGDWRYETRYTGNSIFGALWGYFKNRKYGAVQITVRR